MTIRLLQVDTFTNRVLGGNPAAVCPLDAWLDEATMQSIAAENNLSETAFLVPEGEGYRLRWFTPNVEVDLCGHATLAAAFVVFEELKPGMDSVSFETLSGSLTVSREGADLVMDFRPSRRARRRPLQCWRRHSARSLPRCSLARIGSRCSRTRPESRPLAPITRC